MRIDCKRCEMYRSEHCKDCLVTAVLSPPAEVVELEDELEAPLRALTRAGLLPVLRFRPRPAPDGPSPGRAAGSA